jgi:hypothetical protein
MNEWVKIYKKKCSLCVLSYKGHPPTLLKIIEEILSEDIDREIDR